MFFLIRQWFIKNFVRDDWRESGADTLLFVRK